MGLRHPNVVECYQLNVIHLFISSPRISSVIVCVCSPLDKISLFTYAFPYLTKQQKKAASHFALFCLTRSAQYLMASKMFSYLNL
jgi:hypothetical protein